MIDPVKVSLVKLAAYYEKELSEEQIQVYGEQLERQLTQEEMSFACKLYIDDPKNEFFPRPVSKLIYLVKKPVSTEDMSQNITSILLEAERKYGPHWSDGHFQDGEKIYQGKDACYKSWDHAALSVFGEIGLTVVNRYGGWVEFCKNIYTAPDGVVRAQVKNLAVSLQNTIEKTGSYGPSLTHRGPVPHRDQDLQISDKRNEQVLNLIKFQRKDIYD